MSTDDNKFGSEIMLSPKIGRRTFMDQQTRAPSQKGMKEFDSSLRRKETVSSTKAKGRSSVWENNGGVNDKLQIQENQVVINVAKQNQFD